MLVDTHLHLVDRSRLNYPWLGGAPALNRDFSYAEYERQALRAGITDVLHMEVDVDPTDMANEIAFVRGQSLRPGSLIRGAIAACRPEEPGFAQALEGILADPFVKGFRRVLHVVPDAVSEDALFRENIGRLSGTRLTFDLVVLPRQIPQVIALADLAPGVTFILDHCGVPDIVGGALEPWRSHVAEIARRPNVIAKISGVVAYADSESWTAETLRPYVEYVIECFGWDRLVWGSDWPVCTPAGGLLAWVSATHALLSGCTNEQRENLFWRNADRIWKLGLA